MRTTILNFSKALFCGLVVYSISCTKINEPDEHPLQPNVTLTRSGGENENPYSIENVRAAQVIVDPDPLNPCAPRIPLTPTHLHVKFLPQDTTAYDILHDSLNLNLFVYPLDRQLTNTEIETYRNDTINGYNWEYASVPVDFVFPDDIACQVLDSLYMQGDAPVTRNGGGNQLSDEIWEAVFQKSLELTGNEVPQTRGTVSEYAPSASIKYVDDWTYQTIPLAGVTISVHYYSNTGWMVTDRYGEAKDPIMMDGAVVRPVPYRYKIVWKDVSINTSSQFEGVYVKHWSIRSGRSKQAEYQGPEVMGGWNFTIAGDTKLARQAAVHRALYTYYYLDPPLTKGLTKATNIYMRTRIYEEYNTGNLLGWYNEGTTGHFNAVRRYLNGNPIKLWTRNGDGSFRKRWQITATTFHELGHASHWSAVVQKPGINQIDHFLLPADNAKQFVESWATGVEYAYMRSVYPNHIEYVRPYYDSDNPDYTCIVEALMSQGMTLKEIENTVVGTTHWNGWKTKVLAYRNIYTGQGINPVIVNMLFDHPEKIWRENFGEPLISGDKSVEINTEVEYKLPEHLLDPCACGDGIEVVRWRVLEDRHEVVSIAGDQKSITLKFTAAGDYNIRVVLHLPDGTPYEEVYTINVWAPVSVTGPSQIYAGDVATYTVQNTVAGQMVDWQITSSSGSSNSYTEVLRTGTSLSVVYLASSGANFVVKAFNRAPAGETPVELGRINTYISGNDFWEVIAYKNTASPYDTRLVVTQAPNSPTSPGVGYVVDPDSRKSFLAYRYPPMSESPLVPYIQMIYEIQYLHGKFAYDNVMYSGYSDYGVKFIAYNQYFPGMEALYLIEERKFVNATLMSTVRYLTTEDKYTWKEVTARNPNGTDRDWVETTNLKIVGYAFPYRQQEVFRVKPQES